MKDPTDVMCNNPNLSALEEMIRELGQDGRCAASWRGCTPASCSHWVITVGGYGSFLFEGNEQEAEEMRRHKANWEQAIARKRPATQDEIDANAEHRARPALHSGEDK